MPRFVRTRLSAMMFAFYLGLGAWSVSLSTFLMSAPVKGGLYFTTAEVGWIYSTYAIGGMVAPLFVGLLADRLFRADRVLAVSSMVAAGLLYTAGQWCDANFPAIDAAYRAAAAREIVSGVPALDHHRVDDPIAAAFGAAAGGPNREQARRALDNVKNDPAVRAAAATAFRPLFLLMLGACFATQIGITLITVISLRNLPDTSGFSRVRLFGTVGWIAVGLVVGQFFVAASSDVLYVAAWSTAAMAIYSFTLPRTAPRGTGKTLGEAFGVPALGLLKDRSFAVFIATAFAASALNQFYGVYGHRFLTDAGTPDPVQIMTIGQVCEVAVMFVLPLFHPRRHLKWLLCLGLFGYAVRGLALASGELPWLLAVGVPMHGFCYALFFINAALYIDRKAPTNLRASAQAIVSFAVSGAGVLLGNLAAGQTVNAYRTGADIDWAPVWIIQAAGSLILFIAFVLFFRPPADPA